MHPTHFLPVLAAASFVAAAPAPPSPPPPPPPTIFQLKTVVTAGNPNKNNLYVDGYHTGAGTAAAILTPTRPTNQQITLNDTAIQFNLDTSEPYPAYLNLASDINYAYWEEVTIDLEYGPTYGFYFNNSAAQTTGLGIGLKWNPNYPYQPPPQDGSSRFAGWLGESPFRVPCDLIEDTLGEECADSSPVACDWAYRVPQLFWAVGKPGNNSLIDVCSKVELVRA
jgi:hypothetical protein